MNEMKAYAKINLSLDVVSEREDGYHNLKTIMHTINLYDEIYINENGKKSSFIHTEDKNIPTDNKNIIIKTINEFYNETGIDIEGYDIHLIKNIPVAAGMGGGSTDAASMLKYLNKKHGNPLNKKQLNKLGCKIGADVPFCLIGGTCLCEGIGEIITPLPPLPKCFMLVAKPQSKGLSTAKIFGKVKNTQIQYHPDTEGITDGLKNNSLRDIAIRVYNVLEDYSADECPEIIVFKNILLDSGAECAAMSGSGSSVFGIFTNLSELHSAKTKLKKLTPFVFSV